MSSFLSNERQQAFERWTRGRPLPSVGTNAGTGAIAFQEWKAFKEAFAPEIVLRAASESRVEVRHIIDPFGGSGTTALASRFLEVRSTTIEINPFLADLIRAKVQTYDVDRLQEEWRALRGLLRAELASSVAAHHMPPTFIEPGVDGRWLFSRDAFASISSALGAIEAVRDEPTKRFFKVLLGGVLVGASNVRVAGKGRRYRANWRERQVPGYEIVERFEQAVESALSDVAAYPFQGEPPRIIEGDSRSALHTVDPAELIIFSPPYPNSFDYTDVYNVELWMLGYLRSWGDNRALRMATLSSHVQVKREFAAAPSGSALLHQALADLSSNSDRLWNRSLPDMVGAYFSDLASVIDASAAKLTSGGRIWMVVGDSRYAGVDIRVGQILEELASARGLRLVSAEPFRSMRVSPQQGGAAGLHESLLILEAD